MNLNNPQHSRYPFLSRVFQLLKCVPWWCLLVVVGMIVLFFARVFFFGEHIAFRDGAHFYPPLFEYIQSEWRAGRVPLWNPYENLGQPLLANPVSSVFYPGKLVYCLPISAYHAYHLYVIGHFLLAALTCYRLARHFRCSCYAATIATLSYVFGGSVLFQYSNVVFLIGAAWLPEALTQADKLITTRRLTPVLGLGVVFAMFVLGGDPQMAYHALILIFLLMFFYHRVRKTPLTDSRLSLETNSVLQIFESNTSGSGTFDSKSIGKTTFWSRPIVLLGFSLIIGALLAIVQWLPALELGFNGDRQLEDSPASIYKSVAVLEHGYREHDERQAWDNIKDGVLCRETQQASGIARSRYNFSIGPWRLVEFVWPNANGRSFPVNTNWGNAIAKKWPCTGIWSPSLYMGIITFLLAIMVLRFRKSDLLTLWLSWGALIFLVGSFGYFGLGWVINQTASLFGVEAATSLGSPFGGVYWLFSLLLPGYDQFRYPAKLMTVVSLMLALLSARGFDSIFGVPDNSEPIHLTDIRQKQQRKRIQLLNFSRLLIIVSFLLIPLVLVSRLWVFLASQVPMDPIFGRFVADRALGEAAFSLMHVLNILFLFWVFSRIFSKSLLTLERSDSPMSLQEQSDKHGKYFRRFGMMVILLICCDLVPSNLWMVGTAKRHFFEGKPLMATFLDIQDELIRKARQAENQSDEHPVSFPVRTWRAPILLGNEDNTGGQRNWLPPEFVSPSQSRLTEWVIWERASLSPRYPLQQQISLSDVRGSIVTRDYYAVSQILRDAWRKPQMSRDYGFSLSGYLESLGNSSMIVPTEKSKEDYIFPNQLADPRLTDPIELLDQATREELENYRNDIMVTEEEPDTENSHDTAKADQLHYWGQQQRSIAELLPYNVGYWPLDPAPRLTLVDRIELEKPLTFTSRKDYFSHTFSIITKSQRTGIPVVEQEKERFDHLPVRFAKAFAQLVALGDSPHKDSDTLTPVGNAKLISYKPQKTVIEVKLDRSGFLVFADQFDKNWQAEVRHILTDNDDNHESHKKDSRISDKKLKEGRSSDGKTPPYIVPILRTNRVLRGVPLPEGRWEVTFVYNPLFFRLGATISFFAWGALLMFLLGIVARKIKHSKIWRVTSER